MELTDFLGSTNIADILSEDLRNKIGSEAVIGYEADQSSRSNWLAESELWTSLATQVREQKTFPWANASNVKYPLLTIAAMQFNARAYPALVPSKEVVKGIVNSSNSEPQLKDLAKRIGQHMSYQLYNEMDNWQEDMDKLLLIVPIVGCAFKKTYFDSNTKKNCSELVLAKDLVVNYWTKDINKASRVTHLLHLTQNEIKERQNKKIYLEADLGTPDAQETENSAATNPDSAPPVDFTTPFLILEQHTYLDLDDDAYAEPYVVTVDYKTRKVLRIVPRFEQEDVNYGEKDIIISIKATNYFTKFGFIPNPDGGFYDLGFGHLLGPINEAVNTLVNQLVDAGTLSNLQSGFIAKGLRIKAGNYGFEPGEWKIVNANGDDLKKGIVPLPAREPSDVLFNLLGRLVDSGMKLASIADIFVGKMPGQNTPASTTQETVTQGMKLFTAIYKRLYRATDAEYKKLKKLNEIYSSTTPDNPFGVTLADYQTAGINISPTADADAASLEEKVKKAESLIPLAQAGLVNPQVATQRLLDAQGQENIEELMQVGEKGPNPEMVKLELEGKKIAQAGQIDMAKIQSKHVLEDAKFQHKREIEKLKHEDDINQKDIATDLKFAEHLLKAQQQRNTAKEGPKQE